MSIVDLIVWSFLLVSAVGFSFVMASLVSDPDDIDDGLPHGDDEIDELISRL